MSNVAVVRHAVIVLALAFCALPALAQEKPPQEPPKMEPDKIGPRTEAVDSKVYAKVLHVAPTGSDQADGSAAAPAATIAQALAKVADAGEQRRYAVFVAAGEYKGQTIRMKSHVDLFGGFNAKSWQRDIAANRSILDGEGQRRVVIGADDSRIDGFTIRNGKVREHGAGILCDHASPTISNNTIVHNTTLEPEALDGKKMIHQRGHDGAAIACINGSTSLVTNNIIAHNTTGIGGGAGIAVANYSMPHILNNVIVNNDSGVNDVNESRSSNGAAISATNAQHREPLRMLVINNVITNNRTGLKSKSDAGGIYLEYDSSPVIGANWLLGNECPDDGSAIYMMKSSHPLFTDNIVAGNNSSAIRLSKEGRGDIENNLAFGNDVAVVCVSSWMNFRNNTIVDNKSGIVYGNSYAPHLKPSIITDNIVYGNESTQLTVAPNEEPAIVTNNLIQGGYSGGEGNWDEKPKFFEDGITGQVKDVKYDDQHVTTTVAVGDLPSGASLAGRVIRLGNKWGVIEGATEGKIVVWGDLGAEAQPAEFNIAPTYRLNKALKGDVGAR
ncbi:MAG TPA: right-handed parallel beta-helix repeat-containing protein [Tepidisphaeraceae bacterium]|nr:right-handed parallel beta-helix repeat-containing protein [Tepidisphaeraceae bacterium]